MIEPSDITSKELLSQLPEGFYNGTLDEEEREGVLLNFDPYWEIKLKQNGTGIRNLIKFILEEPSPIAEVNRSVFALHLYWRYFGAISDSTKEKMVKKYPLIMANR